MKRKRSAKQPKIATSLRLSLKSHQMLQAICKRTGVSQARAVELALKQLISMGPEAVESMDLGMWKYVRDEEPVQ